MANAEPQWKTPEAPPLPLPLPLPCPLPSDAAGAAMLPGDSPSTQMYTSMLLPKMPVTCARNISSVHTK